MLRHLSLGLLLFGLALTAHAQRADNALSEGEVEQLRESAYVPNDRVLLFIKLLDTRNKTIQDLFAHPRKPGREEDTHDLLEQFTSIADELNDNLDDYGPRHSDIRKSLPKLVDATERWASNLKSPPDDEAYAVSRRLALEAVRDLHEQATQMIADQKAWFTAHPPAKEAPPNKNGPIEIPRP
ncbi:hypothetical protein [Granulicella sp. L60]|uniref:hypothetical protein n=1 Tax=Granulicella sp. L60 TaxID=1641866 RepID=UPI00131D79AB|nr:hypothetical protein [Granulicella sp. L60]